MSILLYFFIIATILFVLSIYLYTNFHPQFGGKINQSLKNKYSKSKHWNGKSFENLKETKLGVKPSKIPGLIVNQLKNRNKRQPKELIPIQKFNPDLFLNTSENPKFIWYGHATILFRINGKNILIDPMFGDDTAPIAPIGSKRYSENTLDIIDDLPEIDLVLFTHDHYDHLDYQSIKKLKGKINTWWVAMGVGRHLEKWGVPSEQITELDWWTEKTIGDITITYTPSQHFSGRGLTDRTKTLWGGFVFATDKHAIYWSGDGGYNSHFKEIGKKLGPFDWAFLECGQYNDLWKEIHMHPEDAVQAALDVNAKLSFPYHWAGFTLAMHPWKEPVQRFIVEAKNKQLDICTPRLGQVVEMGSEPMGDYWFEEID